MGIEQSLVLIKPDGVIKGLIGKIISRFEDTGLKIIGMKMVWPDEKMAEMHYPLDENWAKSLFEKTKKAADEKKEKLEFDNYKEFGKFVQKSLKSFITENPVVAIVIEGPDAIEIIRKIVGHTEPRQALPGTIRGDFASIESYSGCNKLKRAIRNLIHASDSKESAKREISLWFSEDEIHSYKKDQDKHFEGI